MKMKIAQDSAMTYKTLHVLSEAKPLAMIFYSTSLLFFQKVGPIFIDFTNVFERRGGDTMELSGYCGA